MINSTFFRRIQLQVLMNITARALGEKPQHIFRLSHTHALKAYAEYTGAHLHAGADEKILLRLNSEALAIGRLLRRLLLVSSHDRAQHIIVELYRNIGINLIWTGNRQLCFHDCYFSRHYTPQACHAASAIDDGIIRGITGQATTCLSFTQRITEGHTCCKATLISEKENPI